MDGTNILDRLFQLFLGKDSEAARLIDAAPEKRLYVVGDIHGRADLLERLLDSINDDFQRDPPEFGGLELVFLGDYIDRGDRSADVLESLIALDLGPDFSAQFLKGNHEAMLLRFIENPDAAASWLIHGGLSTLMSYGIRGLSESADAQSRARASRELRAALGPHLTFLQDTLSLVFQSGNVMCVHAALDPELPLESQDERKLLWGTDTFLKEGGPVGKLVIHGHTISTEPDFGRNRIGIDTGAYFSGRLTAAIIDKGHIRFLST